MSLELNLVIRSMVRHIPSTIKQLLTLRNPGAFVGPSTSRLDHLFDKTYTDARMKGAGTGWLVLTVHVYDFLYTIISLTADQTCTLLTANIPSSVGHLYRFVTRSETNAQDHVRKAALMREAALKSAIFVGVPRVRPLISHLLSFSPLFFSHRTQTIGALAGLTNELEDNVKAGLRTDSRRCAY